MRAVKSKNTTPELIVRKTLHSMGYRYSLYNDQLPGKPDITLRKHHKVVFVHGCFWHGHKCKRGLRIPRTNKEYWINKIARNKRNDKKVRNELIALHWKVLIIWECRLKNEATLKKMLAKFLN